MARVGRPPKRANCLKKGPAPPWIARLDRLQVILGLTRREFAPLVGMTPRKLNAVMARGRNEKSRGNPRGRPTVEQLLKLTRLEVEYGPALLEWGTTWKLWRDFPALAKIKTRRALNGQDGPRPDGSAGDAASRGPLWPSPARF